MTRRSKLPTCEKCGRQVDDDLSCKPCGREYTAHWLALTQAGERDAYRSKR